MKAGLESNMQRFIWGALVAALCTISAAPAAAERFPRAANLEAQYRAAKDKVRVSWDAIAGAADYRVRIKSAAGQLVAEESTANRRVSFSGALFVNGAVYKIYVKVKKTGAYQSSRARKHEYTHYDDALNAVSGTFESENSAGRHGSYYLPSGYNQKALPMLVAYHGTGGSGADMVNAFKDLADEFDFMIVAPDSRKSPEGDYTWEVGTNPGEITEDYTHTQNCEAELLAKSSVSRDQHHMLAAGFSGGGSSAPYIATNDSNFTAFAVLHGGVFTSGLGSNLVPGWFSTGTADTARTPAMVEGYADAVAAAGFPEISYHEFSGGHVLSEDEARSLIEWWLE